MAKKYKTLKEIENDYIVHIINETGNNKMQAARILDVSYRTLYNRVEKMETAGRKVFQVEKSNKFEKGEDEGLTYRGMPTNEERLKYLDKRF